MKFLQRVFFAVGLFFNLCGLYASSPKVYDCFLFFNELDLLEIKLNELYDSVDKFIVVESIETFKGQRKKLYFLENQERFHRFSDKIIHVIVTEELVTKNPWDRERFQRNQIMRGLTECDDSDIIIIEDADEIVRSDAIPIIKSLISQGQIPALACDQDLHYWFLNVFDKDAAGHQGILWQGSVASSFSTLKKFSPEKMRSLRDSLPRIANAGWHFSYLGGADQILYKINSFSHSLSDFVQVFKKYPDQITENSDRFIIVPVDERYPKFVRDHLSQFIDKGFVLLS